MFNVIFRKTGEFNYILNAIENLYQIKTAKGDPLGQKKAKVTAKPMSYSIYFTKMQAIKLFIATSMFQCCVKKEKRIMKIYERAKK